MKAELPAVGMSVAEQVARVVATCDPLSDSAARDVARRLMLDISGICVAARHEPYVRAALASTSSTSDTLSVRKIMGSPPEMSRLRR